MVEMKAATAAVRLRKIFDELKHEAKIDIYGRTWREGCGVPCLHTAYVVEG